MWDYFWKKIEIRSMKKYTIFTIVTLLATNCAFANEKVDFSKYFIYGLFKKGDCVKTDEEEYCEEEHFYMYDNKIFLYKNAGTETVEKIDDGNYTLTSGRGSTVNVTIKNNNVQSFKLLSNTGDFLKNEGKIAENDYCEIAKFNLEYKKAVGSEKSKIYLVGIFGDDEANGDLANTFLFLNREHGKILATSGTHEYEYKFPDNKINIRVSSSDFMFNDILPFQISLNKELTVVDNSSEADITIENCVVKSYNRQKLKLQF